ncbi:MAG TPA: hypothetical protein VGZ52_08275 [Acidimicrobiales bacterium]|nr:hypothetical protein [Acidimicrobiales bacterium]
MAGGAFQIRSKKWDLGVLVGSLALLVVGFGGLFALQRTNSAGNPTLFFVMFLGLLTFAFFAGPGLVYVLRKRNAWVKSKLPGGTMAWIRSHLYLPVLALVAAYVHATIVPFRAHLSSGKVLLVIGILVSIAGVCRHHLIGVQKAALNVNVAISKITTGQPRAFRRLVADFTDTARPVGEIDAEMSQFPADQQERWAKVKSLRAEVDKHFPREGGQRTHIRSYKVWRALHPPLTVLLFVVLAFHVWDVLGGTNPFNNDPKQQFVSAESCAGCHSKVYADWSASAMGHAQTSTITVAQLPVTLAHNRALADQGQVAANNQNPDKTVNQDDIFKATAKVCITCHSPVGARFATNADALYPFDNADSAGVKAKGSAVSGGGAVVQSDGVGCEVCHGTSKPPAELQAAFGPLNDQKSSLGGFGTVFGPLFENPNPLPQRIHDIGNGDNNFWNDPIQSSQLCAGCHNVKVDLQGDGLAKDPNADPTNPNAADSSLNGLDTSPTPITDPAVAASHDKNNNLQLDENETDPAHDVVLQTTYDEWQDYIAFFNAPNGFKDRYSSSNLQNFSNPLDSPLGCSDCHMPLESKDHPTSAVVDHAPGLLSIPNREYHTHTFVGVDYDLNPARYDQPGLPSNAIDQVLSDREALVRSAVTLQVKPTADNKGQTGLFDPPAGSTLATQGGQHGRLVTFSVDVRNNLLAHTFPTGFAFARQFWLEVSATTKDGKPVCLSVPFVDNADNFPVSTPCASGVLGADSNANPDQIIKKAQDGPSADDVTQDLHQCDATEVATALGLDAEAMKKAGGKDAKTGITLPNLDIKFAKPFPNDNCDPWLTNFQKILTDGDPNQTGTKNEVAFQSFVPNLVQVRGRIATGEQVKDLQPVRLDANGAPQQTGTFDYTFFVPDSLGITSPDDIDVTATMRVRHLAPYFVSGLAQEQQDLLGKGFNIPDGSRIFDDSGHPSRLEDLLSHMTVTEVDSANSKDGTETLACDKGAQNVKGGSIFDCKKGDTPQFTVKGPGFSKDKGGALPPGHPTLASAEKTTNAAPMALASTVAFAMATPVGWWRLRRRRRRS